MQDTAEALYNMRRLIDGIEEKNKVALDALKVEKNAMQAELLADMTKNEILSLKVKSGDVFFKASKQGIEITEPVHALKWAIENHAVTINKVLVAQKLKETTVPPYGFEITETDYISVRKKADKLKVGDE